MRRSLTITIIALAILGIGAGAYFIFFNNAPHVTVAPTGSASLPVAGQSTAQGTQSAGTLDTTAPNLSVGTPVAISSRLVQISTGPVVSGEVVTDLPAQDASSSPQALVTYIERESGNVFTYLPSSQKLTRINNKTIPGIQSADWLPDASTAFVRYLSGSDFSTINTYALSASTSVGFFLPQNLVGITVSSTSVLTLASGVNGSVATRENTDGTNSFQVFTTPLSALRVSFAGKNQYLAFSKPSATLSGDAFLVDAKGNFSHIAGPLNGLVALASPSGKWVLVSYTTNSTMHMELINTVTNESLPLPVATIADKCVWTSNETSLYCGIPTNTSTSALYPDDWYQGVAHFSDRIWKIDVAGRYAQLTLDFPKVTGNGELDATALAIDPLNTTLVFKNKNDGSLWSYSL